MTYALLDAPADGRGYRRAGVNSGVNQVRFAATKTEKARRIDAIGQIQAYRADRRAVTEAEAHRVHHVIEVLIVTLRYSKRHTSEARIGVSRVMKENAAYIVADQG